MKTLVIYLPYFKQGDDLSAYLDSTKTKEEALEGHAEMLKDASEQLLQIRDIIEGQEVDIYADTHHISISGDDDIMDKLIEANLAEEDEYDDDEDEEDDDEEDD